MSFEMTTRKHIGQIHLPEGTVEVADPGYTKEWRGMTATLQVYPGRYDCYVYEGVGTGIWFAQIVSADPQLKAIAEEKITGNRSWRCCTAGITGDNGLAGFFDRKPEFTEDQWAAILDARWRKDAFIHNPSIQKPVCNLLKDWTTDGFWVENGRGDGTYEVFAIRHKGEIIALEIRF